MNSATSTNGSRLSRTAAIAGSTLFAATLLLGGAAGASAQGHPGGTTSHAAQAGERAALKCKTSYGNTGGWVKCTGKGTWRAVADCGFEPDKASKWVTQTTGPHRETLECTFQIRGIHYESR